ncbi:MAG: apolipoprotein N-acyltransferase [Acidobacteria bacterium 13_1_20CM_3_53_8]|nr:MAG: apolipoprotein N-acyltransferase [Acidobacteria bacterium 13_1_20CM_3_53_8]
MDDAVSFDANAEAFLFRSLKTKALCLAPTRAEVLFSVLSAALLVLAFPDFNLWPLAWVGLVPLMVAVARSRNQWRALITGWLAGTIFFYGSCYWITYAMIRYGGIPAWIAYPLLLPATVAVGFFPALFCLLIFRFTARWGARAIFFAPLIWAALEWTRLMTTGQLWNAIGYSQAYAPALIQTARWGGVYMVGFFIVLANSALAYAVVVKTKQALKFTAATFVLIALSICISLVIANKESSYQIEHGSKAAVVIAVQPNVPMEPVSSTEETQELVKRHVALSENALNKWRQGQTEDGALRSPEEPRANLPSIIIWPESPMNFSYAREIAFQEFVADFAKRNHASVLFNSQEPAPAGGSYNSAVMVNEEGRLVAQYDKIRLLPFGEYVPLPRWLPGASLIPTMVGDFTPGAQYTLMPLGAARAGVFICFESAFPSVARKFTADGADVLINISNDGYLGRTAVMRQHLANAVFRAVENNRPILRVTNSGISAYITEDGRVISPTEGFQPAAQTWTVSRAHANKTFYTKHGDIFVYLCAIASILLLIFSMRRIQKSGVRIKNNRLHSGF